MPSGSIDFDDLDRAKDFRIHPSNQLIDSLTLIGAAWFGNALMLFFACATVIPLLIHLWSRRRFEERPFAAMEFLIRAMRRHQRRISIEQWILLTLRTLLIVLFVVALADPILPSSAPDAGEATRRGPRHWILVLDNSYSMDFRDDQETRLEQSKSELSRVVESAPDGDGFSLLTMGRNSEIRIDDPAFAREDVLDRIATTRIQHGAANLREALARVNDVLDISRYRAGQFDSVSIVFATDLGANTWEEIQSDDVRRDLRLLGRDADLFVLDVGGVENQNQYISSMTSVGSLLVPGEPVRFEVAVQSHGQQNSVGTRVTMLINGEPVSERDVEVTSSLGFVESFEYVFAAPGDHHVEFRLGEDSLELDNSYWHVVNIRPVVRVLIVGGSAADSQELAIALGPEANSARRINVTQATEQEWAGVDLDEFECVILSDVGRIRRSDAERLKRFVKRGGGLMIGVGPFLDRSSYNRWLGGEEGLLPGTFEETQVRGEYALDPDEYAHPVIAPFRGFPGSGLLSTPIWKYERIEVEQSDEVERVINFQNGDPAILERRLGYGRCLLFSTSLSMASTLTNDGEDAWTILAAWPSFVPLIQESIRHVVGGRDTSKNLTVGQSINYSHDGATDSLIVVRPNGQRDMAIRDSELDRHSNAATSKALWGWRYESTDEAGLYRFSPDAGGYGRGLFAVNLDTVESRIYRLDPAFLPSQIELVDRIDIESKRRADRNQPTKIYQWILLLVLLMLIAESLLAWRLGRPIPTESGRIPSNVIKTSRQHSIAND